MFGSELRSEVDSEQWTVVFRVLRTFLTPSDRLGRSWGVALLRVLRTSWRG
jgi:hypothetical protein